MSADTAATLAVIERMRTWRRDGGLGARDATLALDVAEAAARLVDDVGVVLDAVTPFGSAWEFEGWFGPDGEDLYKAVSADRETLLAALARLMTRGTP